MLTLVVVEKGKRKIPNQPHREEIGDLKKWFRESSQKSGQESAEQFTPMLEQVS